MAGLAAGSLDRRITIQRSTVVKDGLGTDISTWTELATVWAQRVPQRAIETWKAGGTAATREIMWRIRWSTKVADVGATDRLVYKGSVLEISGTEEIGRREGIEIITVDSGEVIS
jgi:SPP1 family predicted phage head-tail adaptor